MSILSPQVQTHLKSILTSGRLANAYCLSGDDLQAKLQVARIILKGLGVRPSDHVLIDEGRYFGFVHILTEEGSHKIEDMRNLRRQVVTQSGDAWMVFFIEKAHKLTVQAANSLLKVLEEPPQRVIFFLDAPMFQSLIPTIRSRCQNISLGFSGGGHVDMPLFFDIAYEQLLSKIQSGSLQEWLVRFEALKIDRLVLQEMLQYWAGILREGGHIKALEVVMQNVGYLNRPVNVHSLLMLLVMNLRELP